MTIYVIDLNCSVCEKILPAGKTVFHTSDEFSPKCCKSCLFKLRKTEPKKTMSDEKRIEILKENLKKPDSSHIMKENPKC